MEILHITIWVGRGKEFPGKILLSRWNLNKTLKQEQYESHANTWITKCWILRSFLVCLQHSKPLSIPRAKQGVSSRDDRRDLICCCANLGFGFPLEDFMQRNSRTWLFSPRIPLWSALEAGRSISMLLKQIQVGGSPDLSQSRNKNPFKKCSNCGPIFKGNGSERLVLSNHISLRKNNHTSAFGPIYHTHIVSTGHSFLLLNSLVMSNSTATMWSCTFQWIRR